MAVMMVLTSEMVEKHPRVTPAAFPHPIFAGTASVSVFCVSPPPRLGIVEEGLYIGILGQAEYLGAKINGVGGSSRQRVWVARPSLVAAPHALIRPLCLVSLTYFPLGASRDEILTPQKSWINLSSARLLKLKNMQNRVFLFCRVITKIRGIDGKSPYVKHDYNN
jgi:hypothetical protein